MKTEHGFNAVFSHGEALRRWNNLCSSFNSFHSSGHRGPRTASASPTPQLRDITCFHTPQLCMLSTSSHMSLSIPFPSIQWRSVRDLCALNNAVLKGQEGDEERVSALVSRARRRGGEGGTVGGRGAGWSRGPGRSCR